MAQGLKVGDSVYVPRVRLGLDVDTPSALWRTTVREVVDRSIVVDLPSGGPSAAIASSAAHANVGVVILRVGDFDTETTLLDPLAKSLLQFCRLLLPDDQVHLREVRSRVELRQFWTNDHAAHTHLLLVGHGRADGVRFGHADWVSAQDLASDLDADGVSPKVVISTCCRNGYATFARVLSKAALCHAAIAPFDKIHGAVASQFAQTFLAHHFLQGETLTVAFRHARQRVPGAASFRMWMRGRLTADAK